MPFHYMPDLLLGMCLVLRIKCNEGVHLNAKRFSVYRHIRQWIFMDGDIYFYYQDLFCTATEAPGFRNYIVRETEAERDENLFSFLRAKKMFADLSRLLVHMLLLVAEE